MHPGFLGRLTNDKRAILEQILHDLPITHFSCLEKVLEHCVTHVSSCGFFFGKTVDPSRPFGLLTRTFEGILDDSYHAGA